MLTIAIRPKELKSDGEANVKIRVSHRTKVRYIATPYNVLPEHFDSGAILKMKGKTKDEVDRINRKLRILLNQLEDKVEKKNTRHMDINSLMAILRNNRDDNDFFALIDDRIVSLRREGNRKYAKLMTGTRNHLRAFVSTPKLPFERINYTFLMKLEDHMKYNLSHSKTTIGFHMRNIRTILNMAKARELVEWTHEPFKVYKIPKTQKRQNMVLTPMEMAAICKCEIQEPLMSYCRDLYCLVFMFIGVNPADLFNAVELRGGRLYYQRRKGGREYSVKALPHALHLINRHKGKRTLIDVMDRYSDYETAAKRVNAKLKDIAELCGIKKSVSIYSARHSWSAYGRFLGVSKDDIAAALGHKSIDLPVVTEFYDDIGEEQRRVDEANKKVIQLILRTKYPATPPPRSNGNGR